jgi:hypothetical protein
MGPEDKAGIAAGKRTESRRDGARSHAHTKGADEINWLAASLKRCPDTNRAYFPRL